MSDWKRKQVVTRSLGFYCLIDTTTLERIMASQDERRRTAGDTGAQGQGDAVAEEDCEAKQIRMRRLHTIEAQMLATPDQ